MNTQEEKTQRIVNWMQSLDDNSKLRFAINWRIPHTLFNVASELYKGNKDDLQGVNWYSIFKNKSQFTWSHGGRVY
jgi:hypothetical protein